MKSVGCQSGVCEVIHYKMIDCADALRDIPNKTLLRYYCSVLKTVEN